MTDGQFHPDQESQSLLKIEGAPKEPFKDSKSGRWETFKRAWNELRKGKFGLSVGGVKVETELERERDDSEKNKAEVEKIKLENEKKVIEIAEAKERLEETQLDRAAKVNEELRKTFSDEKTPEPIKFLQLMNLMKANPDIVDQIGKIEELAAKLKIKHGTEVFQLQDSEHLKESVDDPSKDQEQE